MFLKSGSKLLNNRTLVFRPSSLELWALRKDTVIWLWIVYSFFNMTMKILHRNQELDLKGNQIILDIKWQSIAFELCSEAKY